MAGLCPCYTTASAAGSGFLWCSQRPAGGGWRRCNGVKRGRSTLGKGCSSRAPLCVALVLFASVKGGLVGSFFMLSSVRVAGSSFVVTHFFYRL